MLAGRVAKDAQISEMLKESNGPVNFQVFLGLFGDKLSGKTSGGSLRFQINHLTHHQIRSMFHSFQIFD